MTHNPAGAGEGRLTSTLLTDLYQLTMAYGYWKTGTHQKEAVFHLHFRNNPFGSGFSLACGLGDAVNALSAFKFDESDLDYLATICGNDGKSLFEQGFLDYLRDLKFDCDVDAIPEGTFVFPQQPLIRVKGPLITAQIVETALLNIVNFQTLIGTKAVRVCEAARGEPVLEFGLRRAQGTDGALAASRSAYIGGCHATSNVLAGKLFGIPVKGTHAHSWVMSFGSEKEAFAAYAGAMPNNSTLLVDTYDTIQGVRHAIEVGRDLREKGFELAGIRLDSGDLATLSIEARTMLDDAGFPDAAIVASNDLDEHIISSLKDQGARIGVWGVGTKLVTAYDQPAMGGVFKLGAIRMPGEEWRYKVKVSETAVKISTPGIQQVRRWKLNGEYIGDVLYNEEDGAPAEPMAIDPFDITAQKRFPAGAEFEDLLIPIFRKGKLVYDVPPLSASRDRTKDQIAHFPSTVRRFLNPQRYFVGLEPKLHSLRTELVLKARAEAHVD
ncbi:MAG: nicotinate phosphoribosyltransferase [Candidatus Methylacidiphilales bacterium]|nr:nicotinate phosphoribosyltransferase [Candidatus Methylacidiphilales bacterium]